MPIPSRTGISSEAVALVLHRNILSAPGILTNQALAELKPTRVGRILKKLEAYGLILGESPK